MFLHVSVILLTGEGEVSAPLHAGIHPHSRNQRQVPSDQRQAPPPPDQRQAPPGPEAGTPPSRHPLPSAVHAGRYGQQESGTHPTRMQSSSYICTRLK